MEGNTASRSAVAAPDYRFAIAVFVLTFLAFSRLIACDFTAWDDPETIAQNPRLYPPSIENVAHYWTAAGADAPMGIYVPLTYTFWSGLAAVAGGTTNPHVFHAANVALHAMTAALVYLLLRLLLPRAGTVAVFLGAMAFAIHPVQAEPVAWASGTKDLLCGLFTVAALIEYVRFAQDQQMLSRKRLHWAAGIGLYILAMLAKPTGIVVPLLAAAVARWVLQRPWRTIAIDLWPWFLLMAPCAISTVAAQPATWSTPLPVWARPGVAADAIAFYFYKIFLPLNLSVDYGRRPATIVAKGFIYWTWVLPLCAAIWLFIARRRRPVVVAAALLFVIPLLPTLGLKPFMFQYVSTVADHYLYLPMLGVALFAAWAATAIRPSLVAALLVLLLADTLLLEPSWQNTGTLFDRALTVNPDSFIACDMLGYEHHQAGRQLLQAGEPSRAFDELTTSARFYERGLRINPQYVPSRLNLAMVYRELGWSDVARRQIHAVAELQSQLPEGLRADPLGLAQKLLLYGDDATALQVLDELLAKEPNNATAAKLRAVALSRSSTATSNPTTNP
jgi:protein O-mannosyl-transferase